jgi:hypothetical protein
VSDRHHLSGVYAILAALVGAAVGGYVTLASVGKVPWPWSEPVPKFHKFVTFYNGNAQPVAFEMRQETEWVAYQLNPAETYSFDFNETDDETVVRFNANQHNLHAAPVMRRAVVTAVADKAPLTGEAKKKAPLNFFHDTEPLELSTQDPAAVVNLHAVVENACDSQISFDYLHAPPKVWDAHVIAPHTREGFSQGRNDLESIQFRFNTNQLIRGAPAKIKQFKAAAVAETDQASSEEIVRDINVFRKSASGVVDVFRERIDFR